MAWLQSLLAWARTYHVDIVPKSKGWLAAKVSPVPPPSRSGSPGPDDSASQRLLSPSISNYSDSSSEPASSAPPSLVPSFSTETSSDPSSKSEDSQPSTGLTTPDPDNVILKILGGKGPSQLRPLSEDSEEPAQPAVPSHLVGSPGTGKSECKHTKMTAVYGDEYTCMKCGGKSLGRVFICVDGTESLVKSKGHKEGASQNPVEKEPIKDEESTKKGDEDPADRPIHPLLQELTPDELVTKTIPELLGLVIKRRPEHANSRCQIHSALTSLKAPKPKPVKAQPSPTSMSLERSDSEEEPCRYTVCERCDSERCRERVYMSLDAVATGEVTAAGAKTMEPSPNDKRPSLSMPQARILGHRMSSYGSRKTRMSAAMRRCSDMEIYYYGLEGPDWRIPKGTTPRHMLRVPQKLTTQSSDDQSDRGTAGSSTRPQCHAEFHGLA